MLQWNIFFFNLQVAGESEERYPTDIEVTNRVISSASSLQVRRGSEPALNQLLPPTPNGKLFLIYFKK